jgi:diaminohydroxyphosphoribosylaminopyrimidine deaminase/5-amino-6-(5-phosphoribosylamino)uracil reductase
MQADELFMERSLELAALGAGFVAPNPLVGAVLVYNYRVIGEGWHKVYGGPHAEIECLRSVVEADRHLIKESTLYVSLEPCAHYGKTPPCALRIVEEGIRKVVIGTRDPFPEVNGKGIEILRQAGVGVTLGVLENACRWQNRRFFSFHEKMRPYIHLKWAVTADGFMSAVKDERLKISSPISDRLVHKWRSEEAAIMVGTQTALFDKPMLNNRLWSGSQPVRILIDRRLQIPGSYLESLTGSTVIILNGERDDADGNIRWVKIDFEHSPDINGILNALYELKLQSVFIEGGATLSGSFLQQNCWDELHIITNTKLRAGKGLAAPAKPTGQALLLQKMDTDIIEWFVNK